jgi:hypothetical protein
MHAANFLYDLKYNFLCEDGIAEEQVCDEIRRHYNEKYNIEEIQDDFTEGNRIKRKSNVIGIIKHVKNESFKKPIHKILMEIGVPHPDTGKLVKMKITRNNYKCKLTGGDSVEEDKRDLRAKKPRKFDANAHVEYIMMEEKEVTSNSRVLRVAQGYIEQGNKIEPDKWASLLSKIYDVSHPNLLLLQIQDRK